MRCSSRCSRLLARRQLLLVLLCLLHLQQVTQQLLLLLLQVVTLQRCSRQLLLPRLLAMQLQQQLLAPRCQQLL
jgi:hypothetical protein